MIEEYIEKTQIAINEYLKSVKKGNNIKVYLNVVEKYFSDMYNYVRENIDSISATDFARIHGLENSLHQFIVPFKTDLEAPNEVSSSDEYLLKTIVYFTRKQLYKNESVDFSSDSLRKYDLQATEYVKDMCSRLGLVCVTINIKKALGIPKDHNINIVKIDDLFYLIDCTYQQYFMLGQNFKDRYLKSASNIVTCEVGSRMLYKNHGGALEILEKGFIRTDEDVFEDYFSTMLEQFNKDKVTKGEYLDIILRGKKIK